MSLSYCTVHSFWAVSQRVYLIRLTDQFEHLEGKEYFCVIVRVLIKAKSGH